MTNYEQYQQTFYHTDTLLLYTTAFYTPQNRQLKLRHNNIELHDARFHNLRQALKTVALLGHTKSLVKAKQQREPPPLADI
jgi:hypothetical protein